MWDLNPSFRFEIDNFSEKEAAFASHTFVSGGCEWFLRVYPKGHSSAENHLSLSLQVANPKSLPTGWKRSAGFYFLVLNQSEKVLHRTHVAPAAKNLFCAKTPARTFAKTLLLSKLQEKGVLEDDKLIVEVYVNVSEAIDGEGEGEEDVSKMKETKTVEINSFRVLASRSTSLAKLFAEHPDIAKDFKPKNQVVKTEYMNVLLNLIETLDKPLKNQSNNELRKASSELSELMELGFKLDWLRSKLEELSLEMKKAEDDDQSRVQELEQRIKNLEMMDMGKLEERLKNIEVMELGIKMECLKSKFEEDSLERKQSYDADGSRVKQLEESVINLEKIVSDLKVELDKEKDGFLVVGDVA